MKKLLLTCVFFAGMLFGADLKLGDLAVELADCSFIHGEECAVAGKSTTPTLLFFWSLDYAGNQELGKMIAAAQTYNGKLRIIAIGCDEEVKLREFFRTRQLPFAVVVDHKLTNVHAFLQDKEQVPFCVILNTEGRIIWRGAAAKVAAPLKEIVEGKYDFDKAFRIDRYKRELADAMAKRDFKQALKLTDAELQQNPESLDLLVFAVNLLDKGLGDPDAAQARLADAVKNHPRNVQLHEIFLRYLHLRRQSGEILRATDFAIVHFSDDFVALQRLVNAEISFPVGDLSPEALLRLGKAIGQIKTFKDDREHVTALLLYAKILSFCNAPESALAVAKQAKPLLTDSKEIAEIGRIIAHYQEIYRLSRELQK